MQATNVLRRIGGIGLALAVSLMATTSGAWAATESMQATTATNVDTNHTWSDGGAPILKTFHTEQNSLGV